MEVKYLIIFTLLATTIVSGDHPFGCEIGLCFEDTVCEPNEVSGGDFDAWRDYRGDITDICACDWDFSWNGNSGMCEEACQCADVKDKYSTSDAPAWDFDNSGFSTNQADEIVFAVQRSTCYDNVEYAFGVGPIGESEWSNWEDIASTNTQTGRTEDCKVDVARTLTWYEDKENVIKAIHDPNSPMFLTEQFGANSVARIPLPEEYTSQFEYYNEFIVYDGCLNTREVTTFDVTVGGETFQITRHVDNVLKFKIEFPTRLEICTNITVECVEITEVLVNQTVYCTEDGGFAAQVEFQTFITYPYRLDEADASFSASMTGGGSECFNLSLSVRDDNLCEDNNVTKPICIQTFDLGIVPNGGSACDDICTINGDYTVNVVIVPQPNAHPDTINPLFDGRRDFTFSVTSADFCSRVIAEAEITQEMDAYHDNDRDDDDTVFFVEDRVYLEAIYDSHDATIYDVDRLYFTAKNLNNGAQYTLYNNSANTDDGNEAVFSFDTPDDQSGDFNPFYVWPEFNLTNSLFQLSIGDFPVTLELCLGVNITFFANENDGSSGDRSGMSTAVPQAQHPVLMELMEMIDHTKFQLTELRGQILILNDRTFLWGNAKDHVVPDVVSVDDVVAERGENGDQPISEFEIASFVLLAIVSISLILCAAHMCLRKGKRYKKIKTKVDTPLGIGDSVL